MLCPQWEGEGLMGPASQAHHTALPDLTCHVPLACVSATSTKGGGSPLHREHGGPSTEGDSLTWGVMGVRRAQFKKA